MVTRQAANRMATVSSRVRQDSLDPTVGTTADI